MYKLISYATKLRTQLTLGLCDSVVEVLKQIYMYTSEMCVNTPVLLTCL